MPSVRNDLADFLSRPRDAQARARLAELVADADVEELRAEALRRPADPEAVSTLVAAVLVQGEFAFEPAVDTARACAGRVAHDRSAWPVVLLAGQVVWKLGDDPALAEPLFRRARRAAPADPSVLEFARATAQGEEGAGRLLQQLAQARRVSEDPVISRALAAEMAGLAEQQLAAPDRAIEVWRSLLREQPGDDEARNELERLYAATEKWSALVELLKERATELAQGKPENRARAVELLVQVADIWRTRLDHPSMAASVHSTILDIDPTHDESLRALVTHHEERENWSELLDVYERQLGRARAREDRDQLVGILRACVDIWQNRMGNPQRAIRLLEELVELDPDDTRARAALADILEARGDFRALVELRRAEIERRTQLDPKDAALPGLRLALARLTEERIADRSEAIADWQRVVEADGDVGEALQALVRLCTRNAQWSDVVAYQERRIELCTQPDLKAALMAELAGFFAHRTLEPSRAVEVWRRLLALQPGHEKAFRAVRDALVVDADWDGLTQLHIGHDAVEELVELLQNAADRSRSDDTRIGLYERIAVLCRERLDQPELAVRALERIVALDATRIDSADALLEVYAVRGDWPRWAATCENIIEQSADPVRKRLWVDQLREVAVEHLKSPQLAFKWTLVAHDDTPTRDELRDELERLAGEVGGWDRVLSAYQARVEQVDIDPDEKISRLHAMGVIARDRLGKPEVAQRMFRQVLEQEPGYGEAADYLERIYRESQNWEALVEVHRRRLSVLREGADRSVQLRAMAELQRSGLQDLAAAQSTYEELLNCAPDDCASLDAIIDLARTRGDWPRLATALADRIAIAGGDQGDGGRARQIEWATVRGQRLGEVDEALACLARVLDAAPGEPRAIRALEELCSSRPECAPGACEILLPQYRAAQDSAAWATSIEVLLEAGQAQLDGARKTALQLELAGLYAELPGRSAEALDLRLELFERDPSDAEQREDVRQLACAIGASHRLADAYSARIADCDAQADRVEAHGRPATPQALELRRDLRLELAAIARDELFRPGEAEARYREVLELEDTHRPAFEALSSLLEEREAYRELAELLTARASIVVVASEQIELLERTLALAHDRLGDIALAIETGEELLDLDPDRLPVIRVLTELYRERARGGDLGRVEGLLGHWAELVDSADERDGLAIERAGVRLQRGADPNGAVDLLELVVSRTPTRSTALELLDALVEGGEALPRAARQGDAGQLARARRHAAEIVEPIARRQGRWPAVLAALEVRREAAASGGQQVQAIAAHIDAAEIYETRLEQPDRAFDALCQAFALDPQRRATGDRVEAMGRSLRREPDLIELWDRALSGAGGVTIDVATRRDLCWKRAELLEGRLGRLREATQAYRELVDLESDNRSRQGEAAKAMVRVARGLEDAQLLIEAIDDALFVTDDRTLRIELLAEKAELVGEFSEDPHEAVAVWQRVLDIDERYVPALDARERLLRDAEAWDELRDALLDRIETSSDPEEMSEAWQEIAGLEHRHLDDPDAAAAAWHRVLRLEISRETSAQALWALVDLNSRMRRWLELEETLRQLAGFAQAESERADLAYRRAVLSARQMERWAEALEHARQALDIDPADPRVRELLHDCVEHPDTRSAAIDLLEPLYERDEDWPVVLELQEKRARSLLSGRPRMQALLEVSDTLETRLGDRARAFRVACDALAEAADQPEFGQVLERVFHLSDGSARASELFDACEATVEQVLDVRLRVAVYELMGDLALTELGDSARARAAFEAALERDPTRTAVVDALESIYAAPESSDPAALAELIVRRAEATEDPRRRDVELLRAAALWAEHNDHARALELYRRLSTEALAEPEIAAGFEASLAADGRWADLVAFILRGIPRGSLERQVEDHLRVGQIYGRHLDDETRGLSHLQTALELDAEQAVASSAIEGYLSHEGMASVAAGMIKGELERAQDWRRLIRVYAVERDHAESPTSAVEIAYKMAAIQENRLADLPAAFESYAHVLEIFPEHGSVGEQLMRLAEILGQPTRLAEVWSASVDAVEVGAETDATWRRLDSAVELWAEGLEQPARAVPLAERAWLADPSCDLARGRVVDLLERAQMWPELITHYERAAGLADDPEIEADAWMELAAIAAARLQRHEEAEDAYRRVLQLDPQHEEARRNLEALLDELGRHDELAVALSERLAVTSDWRERIRVRLRLASVRASLLENPEAAVDTLAAGLEECGRIETEATTPVARELLDSLQEARLQIIGQLERLVAERPEIRPQAFALLHPLYEAAGDNQRLVAVTEWRLSVTGDPVERHEHYRELARLLEEMGGDATELALDAMAMALAEPGPEAALRDLDREIQRLASELGRDDALIELCVQAAQSDRLADDSPRRAQLYQKAASLALPDRPEQAVECLREVLELQGDSDEALELLDTAYCLLERHEDLAATLEMRITAAHDSGQTLELLRRLAVLRKRVLVQPEEAQSVWRRILELEPHDEAAMLELVESYEATQSTGQLVELLAMRIENEASCERRRELRLQLAAIHREHEDDRESERVVLEQALGENPEDLGILTCLFSALNAVGDDESAMEVAARLAEATPDAATRTVRWIELGRMCTRVLGPGEEAMQAYRAALDTTPGQLDAVRALHAMLAGAGPEQRVHLAQLIMPHIDPALDSEACAEVIEVLIVDESEPERRAELSAQLAEVYERHLDDLPRAYQAGVCALEYASEDQLSEMVDAVVLRARRSARLDECSEVLGALSRSPERSDRARAITAMAASQLHTHDRHDPQAALDVLVPLLDDDIADLPMCERIEELAGITKQTNIIARALQAACRLGGPGDTPAELLLVRLGQSQLGMGDHEGAVAAFIEALELSPGLDGAIEGLESLFRLDPAGVDTRVLQSLEQAHHARGDQDGRARIVRAQLARLGQETEANRRERAALLRTLAEIVDDLGGSDARQALEVWGELLVLEPDSERALDCVLAASSQDLGVAAEASAVLMRALPVAIDRALPRERLILAAARLQFDVLRRPEQALETLSEGHFEVKDELDAIELELAICRHLGEAQALHAVLERAANSSYPDGERVALWHEAARVAQLGLKDDAQAMSDLRALLAVDEDDSQAWQSLFELLARGDRHGELARALEARAAISHDTEEVRRCRLQAADLLGTHLSAVDRAVELYESLLARDPDDAEALVGLERLLETRERWGPLRDLLVRKLDVVNDDDKQRVFAQIVELSALRVQDLDGAVAWYQRWLDDFPEDAAVVDGFERFLVEHERWHELVVQLEVRRESAAALPDKSAYVELTGRLAELLVQRLDDVEGARVVLEEVMDIDPDNIGALLSLSEIQRASGDEDAMAKTLQRAAELAGDDEIGARVHLRLASLATEAALAIVHLQRARACAPADDAIAAELRVALRGAGQWKLLSDELERAAAQTSDPDARRNYQMERVDLLEHQMGDCDAALHVLYGVYQACQTNISINRRIADALFKVARFSEAQAMYGWLLESTPRTKQLRTRAHDLSRWAQIKLAHGEIEVAYERLTESRRLDATNAETLMALGVIYERTARWDEALRVYRALLLQKREPASPGPLRRGEIYLRLSAAHRQLGEHLKARAILRRGIEEDPDHRPLRALMAEYDGGNQQTL